MRFSDGRSEQYDFEITLCIRVCGTFTFTSAFPLIHRGFHSQAASRRRAAGRRPRLQLLIQRMNTRGGMWAKRELFSGAASCLSCCEGNHGGVGARQGWRESAPRLLRHCSSIFFHSIFCLKYYSCNICKPHHVTNRGEK